MPSMIWKWNWIRSKMIIKIYVKRLYRNNSLKVVLKSWSLEYQDYTIIKRFHRYKIDGNKLKDKLKR